jgi:ribosome-binding protein aMBF1 (putative translation factor)
METTTPNQINISTGLTPERRARLEAKGWRVGSADEFLGLTTEESTLIDLTLALARSLRECRLALGWSQQTLAKKMGSSQSRVAKMEMGVAGVTTDLLIRGLLAAGCSLEEVGQVIANAHSIASSQANHREGTTSPVVSRAA